MARKARYEVEDAEVIPTEGDTEEMNGAASTELVPFEQGEADNGDDMSGCLAEDDGYNVFRVKRSQEQLLAANTDELISYMVFVRQSKRMLKAEFDEREKAMNAQIALLEKAIRQQLTDKKQPGMSLKLSNEDGSVTNVSVKLDSKTVYNVSDWDALYEWIHYNGAAHILQKRLSNTTMKEVMDYMAERVNAGEMEAQHAVIPGISTTVIDGLAVTDRTSAARK